MRRASCWHVVSFYAGDRWRVERGERPDGFVCGTMPKAAAQRFAAHIEATAGDHVFVRAYRADRARRIFNLYV